ncbi:MAG: efflux RND transporter periplasmic adaptor subunit [Cytophagales bacterium]|nr:efflux RND transporter periplasmic adaptor subunit [Cytophaga sp.]
MILPDGSFLLTNTQLNNLDIKLVKPDFRALQTFLQFTGKIKSLPNYSATVSSNIDGKVEKVFVREGDYVKQGQPLLTLESMHLIELQDQYLSAKSDVDFMAIEFERQKELKKNNVGALSEYQIVEAKYKAAISKEKAIRAKLELLGINLDNLSDARNPNITARLVIKSPINGYIHAFPIRVGMLANPETTLAEIIDNNELHAEIYVYDKDIDMIKEGQKVQIDFVNHSFENVEGTVISIDRVIDDMTKAITVHVLFQAPDKSLILPDMSIKAILERQKNIQPSYIVPNSALLFEDDQIYVFTSISDINNDTIAVKKTKVTTEDRNETESEIVFANKMPDTFYVASKNVSILEVERRKRIIQ